MQTIEKRIPKGYIYMGIIRMGDDLSVSVYGGDKAHIGAVALATPRKSLESDTKISSSASILTVVGHKEDLLARELSLYLASKLNVTVTVSMGIHLEHADKADIESIHKAVMELGEALIESQSSTALKKQV